MKTLIFTLSLCLFFSLAAFSQTREETEKWITETLQANAQEYKTRQAFGEDKSKGMQSFITYSDFSFQFEDGYFIILCKASYPRYAGADATDNVVMRLPLWDLTIVSDAEEKVGDDTYNISFGTVSKAFQYVNESAKYNEQKWQFKIRVPAAGNEELAGKIKEAFNRVNKDLGNSVTIR